jgi:O-succinylbenzoic acid--CoA ligase
MDLVSEATKRFGEAPALISVHRTCSFRECDIESARMAATLASMGIVQGEIVAIVAPNSPQLLLLLMALLRIGAVAAPVNHRFPALQIEGVLRRLSPKLTLIDPSACPDLSVDDSISLEAFVIRTETIESTSFKAARNMTRATSIIHTSSSSGSPKAAMHSLSNHWHNATGSAMNLPFGPGDCWLLSLPLYHIGGYSMLFKCLTGGGAIASGGMELSLEESLSALPVTHLSLVPTQLYRMLRSRRGKVLLKRLKAILLGGSAASHSLLEEAVDAGLPIHLTYGSTEMGSQVSTSPYPLAAASDDSGTVLPYREAAIAPDGEILVKGPCLFMGYLDEGKARCAVDGEGWFHTGDIGTLSGEGVLTVMGRGDNMFISGGENIHPEEIEKALATIEGVEEAVVVPAPDPEYGMRPTAWIMVNGDAPDDAAISMRLKALLGRLKTPVAFNRVSEWVTIAGSAKIDRGWYRKNVTRDE